MIRRVVRTILAGVQAVVIVGMSSEPAATQGVLAIHAGHVTVSGTSNIHPYTASTDIVRVTRAEIGAPAGSEFWSQALRPGAINTFEISIPAGTLSSPREGLDKNLHKALKVDDHPDITFRLRTLEARSDAPGSYRGVGILKVAGVQREIALNVQSEERDAALIVRGQIRLLMTDFGIAPPTALLGMLKTDPKVTIAFEIRLVAGTT